MTHQKTIKKEACVSGIGLHSGKEVEVVFKPAPPYSGISFVRVDLKEKPVVPADISKVIDAARRPRRTSIGIGEAEVHTVEHLMAALAGLEIDNLAIEISGDEIPGLDGSAVPFLNVLREAGVEEQNAERSYYRPKEPLWINENGSTILILPDSELKISYTLSYNHPLLDSQFFSFSLNPDNFKQELAPSRTFCLENEVAVLKEQGLGKGADYTNTVVIGEMGVVKNKVRFKNECVRHKVLDLLGDLYLLGCPLRGHVIALKSGHSLNIKLLQRIRSEQERTRQAGVIARHALSDATELDIEAIQKIIPHRYPFLLVDKILELEEDKRAVGIKNVTINDNFFAGHFPGRPIMPGVLIVEAMAQVAGVLMLHKSENYGKIAYFMSINNVKFRRTVVPGDQIRLEVEVTKLKSKTGQVHTKALVADKVVAEADLIFTLVEA